MNRQLHNNSNYLSLLTDLTHEHSRENSTALVENGSSVTYAELLQRTARISNSLRCLGLVRGTRVTILLPEGIDSVSIILGALHAGIVAIPINPWLGEQAVLQAISMADPAFTVVGNGDHKGIGKVLHAKDLLCGDRTTENEPESVSPDDIAIGLFTSGTTGVSKICYHTYDDILTINRCVGDEIGIRPTDVCMSASGLHFSYGLFNLIFFPLMRGAITVLTGLSRRMTADEVFDYISAHNVTFFSAIPSFFLRLINSPRAEELRVLRVVATGGEVLGKTLENRLRDTFGSEGLINIFGSTEIGHAVVVNRASDYAPGVTGRVVPGYDLRVVDSSGRPCRSGVAGELEVKGPSITMGVNNGNDRPRRKVNEWYAMGDAARINKDGTVSVLGRLEDIEIIDGLQIYPAEIESEILASGGISEAAVFVAPVDDVPSLIGILTLIDEDMCLSSASIREFIASRLGSKRTPDFIYTVSELPHLSGGGKLARKTIRQNWQKLIEAR